MRNIVVTLVARNDNGSVKYTLTDGDMRIHAYVEKANGVYAVRDSHNEPVHVGSLLYRKALDSTRHYEAWAASHG